MRKSSRNTENIREKRFIICRYSDFKGKREKHRVNQQPERTDRHMNENHHF